jgi:hypothetical protein
MSKSVKTFREQKYLANYWVWPITCSVFLGGKYCMSNFHKWNECSPETNNSTLLEGLWIF